MGVGSGRKQVKNNYNETNISPFAQHEELLPQRMVADVLHLLMSTEHAIFELYFDLNDNDSDVDKFD